MAAFTSNTICHCSDVVSIASCGCIMAGCAVGDRLHASVTGVTGNAVGRCGQVVLVAGAAGMAIEATGTGGHG